MPGKPMWHFSFSQFLSFALKKALQLCVVVVGGGLLLIGLDFAMTPSPPDSSGTWVWIDAPKIPILWHRGWWLECHRNSDIRCTLESGGDHTIIYSGVYFPCDSALAVSSFISVRASLTPDMWVVTPGDNQLAPVVRLQDQSLLVPISVSAQCEQIKKRLR